MINIKLPTTIPNTVRTAQQHVGNPTAT